MFVFNSGHCNQRALYLYPALCHYSTFGQRLKIAHRDRADYTNELSASAALTIKRHSLKLVHLYVCLLLCLFVIVRAFEFNCAL